MVSKGIILQLVLSENNLISLDFFCWDIENSSALRKVSLKTCQLCSISLSLRIFSQGISSNDSLYSQTSALLKFKVLSQLFPRFIFFEITNSSSCHNLFNDLLCISEHQVWKQFKSGLLCQIPGPVILSGLQKSPGFLFISWPQILTKRCSGEADYRCK